MVALQTFTIDHVALSLILDDTAYLNIDNFNTYLFIPQGKASTLAPRTARACLVLRIQFYSLVPTPQTHSRCYERLIKS